MQRFRDINFFRLTVIVGLSLMTSLIVFSLDNLLTNSELMMTFLQAGLAGFSFLQCPEAGTIHTTQTNNRRKDNEQPKQ